MYAGFIYAGLSGHILKGKEPWNLINQKKDSECTEKISQHKVKFLYKGNKISET